VIQRRKFGRLSPTSSWMSARTFSTELHEDGGEETTGILFSRVLEIEEVVRQVR
jgi:hypothetical protein